MSHGMLYHQEIFTDEERTILGGFFTNLDGPVFAVVNLPEVVKGALFARYSRTHKSLRRLFLDEFVADPSLAAGTAAGLGGDDPLVKLKRAEQLYQKVFYEYGDDSVAQLGGAHLACEQASNVLMKVLEWGRLAAYLEQSTRYIAYDQPLGDGYRFGVPPEVEHSPLRNEYVEMMNYLFDTYREMRPVMVDYFTGCHPRQPGDSEWVHRASVKAKALDAVRGLLPASALSNVGIYATGQAYEMAMIRMQAHPLGEVRDYGNMMLTELRKVMPSFLTRVDRPDRGGAWSEYLARTHSQLEELSDRLGIIPDRPDIEVTLTDWDPEAERKLAAGALYAVSEVSDVQLLETVRRMSDSQIGELIAALVGDRQNRRHKPGRALERSYYRFEVVCDYGAFRDLQRHRMLTVEWQPLTARLGYDQPDALSDAGVGDMWETAMNRAGEFYEKLSACSGKTVAQYAVPFAYRIRFVMEMNTREALHLIELRTQPAGHPNYRRVCSEMHRQIVHKAGHVRIGEAFKFLNTQGVELGRLDGERRSAQRKTSALLESE